VEAPSQAQVIARRQDNTSTVGMLIFLASWAMMFAACFYSYTNLRLAGGGWPPDGMPALPLKLPVANTFVIALSSLTLHWSIQAIRKGDQKKLIRFLAMTLFLGALFFALQVLLWKSMVAQNLTHQTGAYGSAFYFMTGFHALHVLVGLVLLALQMPKAARGQIQADRHHGLKLVAMFWHFVDLAWMGTFVMVFLG
jgi:cytochrome c oxidase subunit III